MRRSASIKHRVGQWLAMLVMILGLFSRVWAQDPFAMKNQIARHLDCPQSTADMVAIESFYALGQFDSIVAKPSCLASLFEQTRPAMVPTVELQSVAERFMYLYALSAMQLDNRAAAQNAATMLLMRFPRHKSDPINEPPQFQMLMDSLVTYDAHDFGLYVGSSLCIHNGGGPASLLTDITAGGPVVVSSKYQSLPRISAGLEWQHHFTFRNSFITGINLQSLAYRSRYASRDFKATPHRVGDWELRLDDGYAWVQVPLSYEHRFLLHRWGRRDVAWIGLSGGLYGGYLIHAASNLRTTSWVQSPSVSDSIEVQERDLILGELRSRRAKFCSGAMFAVTFVRQLGAASVFVRLGAQVALQPLKTTHSGVSSDIAEYAWTYHLGDQGPFRLHAVNLTAGVLLPRSNRIKTLNLR